MREGVEEVWVVGAAMMKWDETVVDTEGGLRVPLSAE